MNKVSTKLSKIILISFFIVCVLLLLSLSMVFIVVNKNVLIPAEENSITRKVSAKTSH